MAVRVPAPAAVGRRWLAAVIVLFAGGLLGFAVVAGYYGLLRHDPFIDGAQDAVMQELAAWRDMRDPQGRFRFKVPQDADVDFSTGPDESGRSRQAMIYAGSVRIGVWMTGAIGNVNERTYLLAGFGLTDSLRSDLGFALINEHPLRRPRIRGHYLDVLHRTGIHEDRLIVLLLRPASRPGERWLVTIEGRSRELARPETRDAVHRILQTLEFRPTRSGGSSRAGS